MSGGSTGDSSRFALVALRSPAMPAPDEQLAYEVSDRGGFIVPTPRISHGRPVFDRRGPLSLPLTSGERIGWEAERRGDAEPWLAVHAGVGPARLLVCWGAPRLGSGSECRPPVGYRLESAASSIGGADGDFRFELRVRDNTARARAHVIEFDGQSWLRITFERPDGGPCGAVDERVGIARLELHDASDGTDDVWLILGDDLARAGFAADTGEPGFAELIHERYPGYYPALIDETRRGERPAATLARVAELLETHRHVHNVAIAYADTPNGGANTGPQVDTDGSIHDDIIATADEASANAEATALAALVSTLLARDWRVTIARPPRPASGATGPHVERPSLDRAFRELEAGAGLVAGPDLRSWFAAHHDQLDADGLPTPEGRRAMRRLWVEALDVLYVPQ
jgi:hypothetical protein